MNNWIDTKTINEDIVISSRVRLARNLKDSLFPNTLEDEDGRNIAEEIIIAINTINEEYKAFKLWENDDDVDCDISKHLVSSDILNCKDKAAYIKNNDETLSIMINEEDHIKMQSLVDGLNLRSAFDEIMRIDDLVEEKLNYAFHDEYGYVTASLTNIGSGLRVSVMIHLPALTISQGIQSILKGLNQVGMTIRGVYGDKTSALGNIYLISNLITLGVQEDELISNLEGIIDNIIDEEKRCRDNLLNKSRYDIEDKIYRALGILKSARLISYKECLDLLSSVRMGVEMGIINIEKRKLNRLLVLTTDKLIAKKLKAISTIKEMERERARVIQEILKG